MVTDTTKLELTWIGKKNRPRLEPRILVEESELSYRATRGAAVVGQHFDNLLIHGDNLLALKALEHEFAGKVKCVYIDPPFNTKQAFDEYDDCVEHSLWLTLMRERLVMLHRLLSDDGTIAIHIDDNELGYLIVLMDEIFGRNNRQQVITFKQGDATGHKAINPGCVSTTNFILLYARNKASWKPRRLFTARDRDARYGQFIKNRHANHDEWEFSPLMTAFADHLDVAVKVARSRVKSNPEELDRFVLDHADSVIRLARPGYDEVSEAAREVIDRSTLEPEKVFFLERDAHSDMYFLDGQRILFYSSKLKFIDGKLVSGEPLTTMWDDIKSNNLHNEGGVEFKKGKKPEALIRRVLEMSTDPGDLVLDSFAGSATTAAVAHKMGRRWITVELGEHAKTHCVPRLQKVISGMDPGGVTEAVDWKGGGGFRFMRLAPSLLIYDKWDNYVINPVYRPEQLAEAVCKLQGFRYSPSQDHFWMHGTASERDFLYVTTQHLVEVQLEVLSDTIGAGRTLLICCGSWEGDVERFPNLTLSKIPQAVLSRCEWGKDDYSLNVAAVTGVDELMPSSTPEEAESEVFATAAFADRKTTKPRGKKRTVENLPLLPGLGTTKRSDS